MSDASGSDFDNSDNSDNSDANDSDDDFEVNANLEDDEDEPVIMSQAQVKARNVQQMLSGSLQVARTTMVSGLSARTSPRCLRDRSKRRSRARPVARPRN